MCNPAGQARQTGIGLFFDHAVVETKMEKRAWLRLVTALLSGFIFIACNRSSPPSKLVVYSPHGKELLTDVSAQFEQSNPGVRVEWLDMGSQDALDRVRSEKANPQADIWWGGPSPLFIQAARENLLLPYRPTWAAAIDSSYRDMNDLWYGTYVTPDVIMFNSEKLSREEAPKDWDDLLDQKWRDRIVLREPLASGTMRAIFFAMIYRERRIHGSPEKGYDWLLRLEANVKSYAANPTLLYLALARGEADLTLWNLPDVFLQREQYHYPFDYVVPAGGVPMVTEGIAIVAGAKNPELARKFYELVTAPEALVFAAKKYYRIPTRTDLDFSQIPPEMDARRFKVLPLDWQLFADSSAAWMQYWDARIRNRGRSR
jgi:iron(III) transport system substrate-binding protein